jgi:hypothetical protein
MKKLFVLLPVLLSFFLAKAQYQDVHISLEAQGVATTNNVVPFWLRANQFGSVPLSGGSGNLIGKIRKDYDTTKTYGWGFSFEVRGNSGKESRFLLIEGLIKARAGIFELKAGRSKDIVGLVDSSLSSGSFSVSGNALGIPKISISIPDYYSLPFWDRLFAIKGSLANGYAGTISSKYRNADMNFKSYYLENYLYVKIGKPSWRLNFEAGYNHQVLWGDERKVLGPRFNLSGPETYWYVFTGKVFNQSKVGNHLGSLDVGAEYKFDAFTLKLYRQSFYDKGGLWSLNNIKDGLNGISFTNNQAGSGNFVWKKLLFEFLYTANQGGTINSKITHSGAEDYYNNYEYVEGWSYKNSALGSPFITTAADARADVGRDPKQFFINNRLYALHGAAQFYAFKWNYTAKVSWSHNLGTFQTGTELFRWVSGKLTQPSNPGAFGEINQLSLYLGSSRPLQNGYSIGYDLAYDCGGLLYNSFGVILKVSKAFM